jgi:hypothetical protein
MAGLCEDWETAPLTLSDSHKDWFTRHHSFVIAVTAAEQQTAESIKLNKKSEQGRDSRDVALGWAGLAAVQVAEGKWKEAKDSIERGNMNVGRQLEDFCGYCNLIFYCSC